MFQIRPSYARRLYSGWLDSKHSFSFGNYYDPNHMGFRNLRVINEDKCCPARLRHTRSSRQEIISYVISGQRSPQRLDEQRVDDCTRRCTTHECQGPVSVTVNSMRRTVRWFTFYKSGFPNRSGHTPGYEERAILQVNATISARVGQWGASADALHINSEFNSLDLKWMPVNLSPMSSQWAHAWVQIVKGL